MTCDNTAGIPAMAAPLPGGPDNAALMSRLVRIETRLTRLLHHFGLETDGTPRVLPAPSTWPAPEH